MFYDQNLEIYRDISFTRFDPCIWVVYDAGAAGDLLASMINMHYFKTGAKFFGIKENGQIIFRPSDNKISNEWYKKNIKQFDESFADTISYGVNNTLSEDHLNYSRVDQIIFSNHLRRTPYLIGILSHFPQAKIIKIVPGNNLEKKIINWLANFKNNNNLMPIEFQPNDLILNFENEIINERLLTVKFGNIFIEDGFEKEYDKILTFLDLPFKLIRFDYIKFWIEHQHPYIKNWLHKNVPCSNG